MKTQGHVTSMVAVELTGVYRVKARGKWYYYAWRNGPRIKGEPGSEEFMASYNEAIANRTAPKENKSFRSVVTRYKASKFYTDLSPSTRKNWSPWLDKISDYFGKLDTAQFNRTEKIRPVIRRWRAQFADTPRTADYGMQVLSRVIAHGIDPLGEINANPCEGIKHLYKNDRSEIIWTDEDIAAVKAHASVEVAYAVDLAALTGLRASDLVLVSWSHIDDDAIIFRTGKSRGKREVIVPLYDELRELLNKIPRRATTILANSFGRPWSKDGLSSRFTEIKHKTWPDGDNLHFHDLRGTAATKFYLAGFSEREIAEMMGWEEEEVRKIIRRYVHRAAAIKDKILRLREARNVLQAPTGSKA